MNVLSMYALIGAYKDEGYEWVDELCQVITDNVDFACDYINNHFPDVDYVKPQGTYMLFIDCKKYLDKNRLTLHELLKRGWDVGVTWQDGTQHGGTTHIRLNLALPLSRVKEAFDRMAKYIFI
jgi:cystathionine beta-lyase